MLHNKVLWCLSVQLGVASWLLCGYHKLLYYYSCAPAMQQHFEIMLWLISYFIILFSVHNFQGRSVDHHQI